MSNDIITNQDNISLVIKWDDLILLRYLTKNNSIILNINSGNINYNNKNVKIECQFCAIEFKYKYLFLFCNNIKCQYFCCLKCIQIYFNTIVKSKECQRILKMLKYD
jgi:hypothetical protein